MDTTTTVNRKLRNLNPILRGLILYMGFLSTATETGCFPIYNTPDTIPSELK